MPDMTTNQTENFKRPDLGCTSNLDRVIDHEKQLTELNTLTGMLAEQNKEINETLKELSKTMIEIKDVFKEQKVQAEQIAILAQESGEQRTTLVKIEGSLHSLIEDFKERETELVQLTETVNPLKWIAKGFKLFQDKIGVIVISTIIAIILMNLPELIKWLATILTFLK